MSDSILESIKKMLGLSSDYKVFDMDLIIHINSVLAILYQLGVGKSNFSIEGKSDTWDDFLEDATDLELVKSYVYFKVRYMFDPPTTSQAMEACKNMIAELEWRINVTVDPGTSD